ncbi:MAG: hypothetical protein ACOY4H_14630 [Thermodesulfobacteriota bacterium]
MEQLFRLSLFLLAFSGKNSDFKQKAVIVKNDSIVCGQRQTRITLYGGQYQKKEET